MTDKLKAQIDDLDGKLRALVRQRDGLDHQIEILKVRVEAFREAHALVNESHDIQKRPAPNGTRPVIHHADPWQDALRVMRGKGRFTTDEIMAEAKARGSDVERPKARVRLAHLVSKNILIRIQDGVFEFPKDEARL
jgi:hypothetical protein